MVLVLCSYIVPWIWSCRNTSGLGLFPWSCRNIVGLNLGLGFDLVYSVLGLALVPIYSFWSIQFLLILIITFKSHTNWMQVRKF
uniref:Putative secreted protein n=1 Tax=Xenopsylla cheopis TaxID=163159 RepID=A0A6M2DYW8_XENCH